MQHIADYGNEMRISKPLLVGLLRAVGGKVSIYEPDCILLENEELHTYQVFEPRRIVIELRDRKPVT